MFNCTNNLSKFTVKKYKSLAFERKLARTVIFLKWMVTAGRLMIDTAAPGLGRAQRGRSGPILCEH
jgi:hypothetical protein